MRYFTKSILWQLVAMEVLFFLIAGIGYVLSLRDMGPVFLALLVIYPIIALVIPLYSCSKDGFNPIWPWATFVLFLPPLFTIFNSSALIYGVAYTVISALGCAIGVFIHRRMGVGNEAMKANPAEG